MHFQHSDSSNAINFIGRIKRGNWGFLLLRFTGTNDTGETLAIADIGEIWIQYKGRKIIQVNTAFLSDIGDQYGGYLEFSSTISAAFTATVIIPFYLPDWPNSIFNEKDEDMYVGMQYGSSMATRLGSGNVLCNISAQKSNIPMTYLMTMLNADRSAITGRSSEPLTGKNIVKAYLYGTDIDTVFMAVDGEVRYNDNYASIRAAISFKKNVESALVTYLDLNTVDNPSDFANNQVLLEVFTGSAITVYIVVVAVEFGDTAINNSIQDISAKSAMKLSNATGVDQASVNRLKVAQVRQLSS